MLTGGTGFIGRPLLRRLVAEGWDVLLLGRAAPAFLPPDERRRVRHLRADLGRPDGVARHRRRLAGARVALLAGGFVLPSSDPRDDDVGRALAENVLGTAAVLAALGPNLEWLGYVSTVDVYGAPHRLPMDESHPAIPHTHYGVSKLAAEGLTGVFARRRGAPRAALRLAQVYGPGDPSRKAIPSFVAAAAAGRPVVLRGPGTERRSYLYVDDAVEALAAALDRRADGVFNIAGPEQTTVARAAALIAAAGGVAVERHPGLPRASMTLDSRAARRTLGFRARVSLAEGLRRCVEAARGR